MFRLFPELCFCLGRLLQRLLWEKPEQITSLIQWYDPTIADHNYARTDPVVHTQSKAVQTDQIPDVSVPFLGDAGMKFYTGLSKEVFWGFLNSMLIFLP